MDVITNTGPHVTRVLTQDVDDWIRRAPVVKALDDVYPLTIAHPDAWRIFRVFFADQNLDADPIALKNAVLAKLGSYRHAKLFVEMYVGLNPADAVKHANLLEHFQILMHDVGVNVCGPSWYDGNGTKEQADLFAFVDAYATQGYWGNTPDGVAWNSLESRKWHALRYRKLFPDRGDKPLFLVEMGRDYLPEEGTDVAGWLKQGVPSEIYVGECVDADEEYRIDNVWAVLYSAGTYDVPDDPANQGPFDTASIAKTISERTVWQVDVSEPVRNPWRGIGLIVHNLPADSGEVIRRAELIAARYVDIKIHDGDSPWTSRRNISREYVATLREANLSVTGWGYVYCDGEAANGRDRGNGYNEWIAAIERMQHLGLDGYTADFEVEAEGNTERVNEFLSQLKIPALRGRIAAFVWATLYQHEATPAEAIARHVDVLRPMVYQPIWSMDNFYDAFPALRSWHTVWNGPVCPALGITDTYVDSLLESDLDVARRQNAAGISAWEYSAVEDNERARLIREWLTNIPAPSGDIAAEVDAARAAILDAGGKLMNLGWHNEGLAAQLAVKLGKGEKS